MDRLRGAILCACLVTLLACGDDSDSTDPTCINCDDVGDLAFDVRLDGLQFDLAVADVDAVPDSDVELDADAQDATGDSADSGDSGDTEDGDGSADAEPDADSDAEPDSDADAGPDADADADADADVETDADADPDADAEPDAEPDFGDLFGSDVDADAPVPDLPDIPGPRTCTSAGAPCGDVSWSNGVFVCNMGEARRGECLLRCALNLPTRDYCARGAMCFGVGEELAVVDPTTGVFLDGACVPGDCNDACFELSAACSEADLFTCDTGDGPGTCLAYENGASFCAAAGDDAPGSLCEAGDTAVGLCAPGSICHHGRCTEPCVYDRATAEAACPGDDACLPHLDRTGRNSPGVCSEACGAFSEGECPRGESCAISVGTQTGEVYGWHCSPGEVGVPVSHLHEACDPDPLDGLDSQCAEGLFCRESVLEDGTGRCDQICDPEGELGGPLRNCARGEGIPELACIPTGTGGVGLCVETCEPYPFTPFVDDGGEPNGRWLSNGCPHTEDIEFACIGHVIDNDVVAALDPEAEILGYCVGRPAATSLGGFGDPCEGSEDCNPDSWCVELLGERRCTKTCLPFSGDGPSDCGGGQVCLPTTNQAVSVCVDPASDGGTGDTCPEPPGTVTCALDDSWCAEVTFATYECLRLCQLGVESTCDEGLTCSRIRLSDLWQPEWVGLCEDL